MEFLLDPDVVYLNHGSFGACPREVHEEYQRLQRQLESQPVRFMESELPNLLAKARSTLARFIGADNGDVVFVKNPTYAINEIARALRLGPTDELLVSDQEYGACHNAWRFMSQRSGFSIVEQAIRLPATSNEEIVEQFWSGVTRSTRVIFISHITSPTALTIPVGEICRRARDHRIVTVIDGAHVPGQIDLDVRSIDADLYTGACHKWLCAPKGASFLYAQPDAQLLLEPLVVGWGWGTEQRNFLSGSDFLDYHEWLGTDDPSAYLSVPKAIEFQRRNDWSAVQIRCKEMAVELIRLAEQIPNVRRVHDDRFFQQMALLEVQGPCDARELKAKFNQRQIEVPVVRWKNRIFIRISIQAYNTMQHVHRFVTALKAFVS